MIRSRRFLLILIAAGILMAVGIYFFFDPMGTAWMPRCPVNLATGLDCPGCGSQRAFHALSHGNIKEAFAANALFVVMIPVLTILAYAELNKRKLPEFYKAVSSPYVVFTILGIVILWTVYRNIV